MDKIKVAQPLKVEGTYNVRDLGGYETHSGRKTRSGVFLRTDGLHALTESGKRFLLDYGVRCIVDLRTAEEIGQAPDPIGEKDGVESFSISLSDGVAAKGYKEPPKRMGEMYVLMLSHSGESIAEIFSIFASHISGTTLFHCSAGKDRTGVTAMLLLSLVGVDKKTIIADYAVSYENLKPSFGALFEKVKKLGIEIPEHVLRSDPSEMEMAMAWLEQNHGTAERYLLNMGVKPEELAKIKDRLLEHSI